MERKARSHLTQDERCQIYALLQVGCSLRSIGRQLGVHHSTIIRELHRNTGQRGYRPKQAMQKAVERRYIASGKPRKMTSHVIAFVVTLLETVQASPEQITGSLFKQHGIRLSPESIYRWIHRDKRQGGHLHLHLRHQCKKHNKRFGSKSGRGVIPGRIDISQRPSEVEDKLRFGDFEIDTIEGSKNRGHIVSIVDRSIKYVWFRKVSRKTKTSVA